MSTNLKSNEQYLRDSKARFQAKIDALTKESQFFLKDNDKLHVVCQTAVDENAKMKSRKQILLQERQRLISMNTKLTADQRKYQSSSRYWQSDADKRRGQIDRMIGKMYKLGRNSWIWPWHSWINMPMN
jgi:alpha-D-ribose 1-methylphosphonate 5-triphosphate diphosphatase PhnM